MFGRAAVATSANTRNANITNNNNDLTIKNLQLIPFAMFKEIKRRVPRQLRVSTTTEAGELSRHLKLSKVPTRQHRAATLAHSHPTKKPEAQGLPVQISIFSSRRDTHQDTTQPHLLLQQLPHRLQQIQHPEPPSWTWPLKHELGHSHQRTQSTLAAPRHLTEASPV